LFKPNLDYYADLIEPIVTRHLLSAHLLFRSVGEAFGTHRDGWSVVRSAIEPHEQDKVYNDDDLLINVARDLLEWFLEHEPEQGHQLIERWARTSCPLLERLAIHGIVGSSQLGADEKINWLLDKNWLHAIGLKHEVFRLLRTAYPKLGKNVRVALLNRIESEFKDTEAEQNEAEGSAYYVYFILQWLHDSAPDCNLVKERLDRVLEKYPDFRPRQYPDLNSWSTPRSGTTSPFTLNELLAKPPREQLAMLLSYEHETSIDWDWTGVLLAVQFAGSEDFDWGYGLAEAFAEQDEWTTELWKGILWGWRERQLSEVEWEKVLSFLKKQSQVHSFAYEIAKLLSQGAREGIPFSQLDGAESVADSLWQKLNQEHETINGDREQELRGLWEHPAARLTEFYIIALWRRRREAGDEWEGISEEYRSRLDGIIKSSHNAADAGRAQLASETRFFLGIDIDWAREHLLKFFDWSSNARQAQQAWYGFLERGRWSEKLVPELMPLYCESFSHLVTDLENVREDFCEHLALCALSGMTNPVTEGWLGEFIAEAELQDRITWARKITRKLWQRAFPVSVKEVWELWMREYWRQRIQGIPKPLDPAEMAGMAAWVPYLSPVLPEVVDRVCENPVPQIKHTPILRS